MHLIGNVDFRDTSNNVAIAVQLVLGVAILKTLDMNTNNITNIGSITCNTIACTGTSGQTSTPTSRGIYMGFESALAGGIDICADFSQYINFTTVNNEFRGRMVYNTTVNDFNMCKRKCNIFINIKHHNINNEQSYRVSRNLQLDCMHRNIRTIFNSYCSRCIYRQC